MLSILMQIFAVAALTDVTLRSGSEKTSAAGWKPANCAPTPVTSRPQPPNYFLKMLLVFSF